QRPNEATVVPPSEHPRLRQRRLGFQEPPAGREHHRSQSLRALRGTPNLDTVPTVERASSATRGAHEAAPTDTAWTNAQCPTNMPGDRSCPLLRSEEHTSELQSRFDLVCRLLLEK